MLVGHKWLIKCIRIGFECARAGATFDKVSKYPLINTAAATQQQAPHKRSRTCHGIVCVGTLCC